MKSEESEDDLDEGDEVIQDEEDDYAGDDLAALMDEMDEADDDEEDDPLIKLDPLYSVPLGKVIEEVVKQAAQESQPAFVALAQQLPADLQQITQGILQGNG